MAGIFAIQPTHQGLDGMLQRYAGERDEVRANQLLGELFDKHVREAVRRAVARVACKSYSMPFEDAEDLKAEVTLSLVGRLRKGRREGLMEIASLGAYAEQIARNAAHNRNNRNRPLTAKLAANMRYAIKSTPSLAMWRGADGALVVGLAEWLSPVPLATCRHADSHLTDDLRIHAKCGVRGQDARATLAEHPELLLETIGAERSQSLREQLTLLFKYLGQPIAFSSAVALMAAALGCTNAQTSLDSEFGENGPLERAVDPSQDTFASAEQRAHLRALWDAIHGLTPLHRAALLLNLRDPMGRGVLGLLPELGIASRPEIALAVAMPVAELEARWDDLPMDDAAIGERYGVTASRVIGLRRTARERLARAMQAA